MSAPLRPRGPLPARVYWVRRLLVLGVAVVLVVGIAQLFSGGSDGSDGSAGSAGQDTAARMSAPTSEPSASETATGDASEESSEDDRSGTKQPKKPKKERLADPEGPCTESDITVTPRIEEAEGGSDVDIKLALRTEESEACTWEVSAETLSLKITSGSDLIWTSLECPRDLPEEDVVVRRDVATKVVFTWDARRSDDDCPQETAWALPGTYHVTAAALAGEPTDVRFELVRPAAKVVEKTVEPKPRDRDDKRAKRKERKDRSERQQRQGSEEAPTDHEAGEEGVSEPNG